MPTDSILGRYIVPIPDQRLRARYLGENIDLEQNDVCRVVRLLGKVALVQMTSDEEGLLFYGGPVSSFHFPCASRAFATSDTPITGSMGYLANPRGVHRLSRNKGQWAVQNEAKLTIGYPVLLETAFVVSGQSWLAVSDGRLLLVDPTRFRLLMEATPTPPVTTGNWFAPTRRWFA